MFTFCHFPPITLYVEFFAYLQDPSSSLQAQVYIISGVFGSLLLIIFLIVILLAVVIWRWIICISEQLKCSIYFRLNSKLSSKTKYSPTMSSNGGIISYENGAYNVSVKQGQFWQARKLAWKASLKKHIIIMVHVWYVQLSIWGNIAGINERGIDLPFAKKNVKYDHSKR